MEYYLREKENNKIDNKIFFQTNQFSKFPIDFPNDCYVETITYATDKKVLYFAVDKKFC